MPPPLDLTGVRPDGCRYVIMSCAGVVQFGGPTRLWACRCDCGVEFFLPQKRIPYSAYIRKQRSAVFACDSCGCRPCAVCGKQLPRSSARTVCEGECQRIRMAESARASYERNREAVKRRSTERHKRERAKGNPVYQEIDRRKHHRLKADPKKWAKVRARAREWYARNAERIREQRLASRPPLDPKVCRHCGKTYIPARRDSVFCSAVCRQQDEIDRRRKAAEPLPPRRCVICQGSFVPRHPSVVTCSDECREARRRMQIAENRSRHILSEAAELAARSAEKAAGPDRRRICPQCGRLYLPGRRGRKHCSPDCRLAAAVPLPPRTCIICPRLFQPDRKNAVTCSPDCRAEYKRRRALARLHGAPSLGSAECRCEHCGAIFTGHPHTRYCSESCIRLAREAAAREKIDRDKYVCTICGKSTADLDLKIHRYTCSDECRREANRRRQHRNYLKRRDHERTGDPGPGSAGRDDGAGTPPAAEPQPPGDRGEPA